MTTRRPAQTHADAMDLMKVAHAPPKALVCLSMIVPHARTAHSPLAAMSTFARVRKFSNCFSATDAAGDLVPGAHGAPTSA